MKIIDAVLGFFKPTVVEKEERLKVEDWMLSIVQTPTFALTHLLKMSQ